MPSEKRARQRALRDQKLAVVERRQRRVRRGRRVVTVLVVVGIVIGLVALLSSHSTPPKKSASSKTTTTTAATTTTTTPKTVTNQAAIAPTCPPATAAGAATRETHFTKAPPACIPANGVYDATVETDVGTFVFQMKAADSFAAVNNFVFLARYHFYDGIIFQRVIPGFVVQGGDPLGTGAGGPGYTFTGNTPASSCTQKKDCYPLGSVALANSNSDVSTDSSQFFVVVGAEGEQLPASYTLFGQVISGMSVVDKIAADGNAADDGTPPKVTHHMIKVTITEVAA